LEKLKTEKVLHYDPAFSELVTEWGFAPSYDWLAEQMIRRVGLPPEGVKYPFWAWHTLEWKNQKPDLRRMEFRGYIGDQVCLELAVPDTSVLLSDEEAWHDVLNDRYYGNSTNEQEFEAECEWFESLPPGEQDRVKRKSWEEIFNVSPPFENDWDWRGKYIQATFWELRLDQIIAIRHFKGRR
jgi:hypothetical protein